VLASPRSFSQLAASFFAVESQGILPCALLGFTLSTLSKAMPHGMASIIFSQYVKELPSRPTPKQDTALLGIAS
jgi:hypothetical protein